MKPIAEGIVKWLGRQCQGKYISLDDLLCQLVADRIYDNVDWLQSDAEEMNIASEGWGCYWGAAGYYSDDSPWEPLIGNAYIEINTPNVKMKVVE